MIEKIIHLRQHYHFGPEKIAMYLKRYYDVPFAMKLTVRYWSSLPCPRHFA